MSYLACVKRLRYKSTENMKRLSFLILWVWIFTSINFAIAQDYKQLSDSDWSAITQAKGIEFGAKNGYVQVIYDVNCPYSAKLFDYLQSHHSDIAIRWVPIAYFRKDSAVLAKAIHEDPDPQQALRQNFKHYDFKQQHGAYVPKVEFDNKKFNATLKQKWIAWVGGTPLIVVKTQEGQILMHAGANDYDAINKIINLSGGLKGYKQ